MIVPTAYQPSFYTLRLLLSFRFFIVISFFSFTFSSDTPHKRKGHVNPTAYDNCLFRFPVKESTQQESQKETAPLNEDKEFIDRLLKERLFLLDCFNKQRQQHDEETGDYQNQILTSEKTITELQNQVAALQSNANFIKLRQENEALLKKVRQQELVINQKENTIRLLLELQHSPSQPISSLSYPAPSSDESIPQLPHYELPQRKHPAS